MENFISKRFHAIFSQLRHSMEISVLGTHPKSHFWRMFRSASSFNQPIGTDGTKWDMSKVRTITEMFYKASAFNQDIQLGHVKVFKCIGCL